MTALATMSAGAVADVRRLETAAAARPQVAIETTHTFHAGVYARTVRIPAGVMITGAFIKVPTVLVISGDIVVYTDGGAKELRGYHVLAAGPHRKSAFVARADTHMTMLFATTAQTVDEAEREFTDEVDLLASRREEI